MTTILRGAVYSWLTTYRFALRVAIMPIYKLSHGKVQLRRDSPLNSRSNVFILTLRLSNQRAHQVIFPAHHKTIEGKKTARITSNLLTSRIVCIADIHMKWRLTKIPDGDILVVRPSLCFDVLNSDLRRYSYEKCESQVRNE